MYQYQNDWDENEWEGLGIEDDLISRRAMYIALYELGGCDATEDYYKGYDSGIGSAISALQCAPTAEMKEELQMGMNWIPVTERLPEDGIPVLCTLKNYPKWVGACRYVETVVALMFKGSWTILTTPLFFEGYNYVTAWMPLPAPYKIPEERNVE